MCALILTPAIAPEQKQVWLTAKRMYIYLGPATLYTNNTDYQMQLLYVFWELVAELVWCIVSS